MIPGVTHPTNQEPYIASNPDRAVRWAWIPILLFLLAIASLWVIDSKVQVGSPFLLVSLNFVFSALTSLVIVFLTGRSFIVRGSPGLLLLGCGVLVWGVTTVLSVLVRPGDVNTNITIFNCGAWLAALCHFVGALLSLRRATSLPSRAVLLTATYASACAVLAFIAHSAASGEMPVFFVQGQGGTPVRQMVLLSTITMFSLTAMVLRISAQRAFSSFLHWYSYAMMLIAVGLGGVLMQSTFGSPLNWTARAAQYLGGIYMLIAAIVSVRDSQRWEVSLASELSMARKRYKDLFDLAVDGIAVYEITRGYPKGRLLQANRAVCELLGYELDELASIAPLDVLAPEERRSILDEPHFLTGDGVFRREVNLISKDGRRIQTDTNTRVFRDRGVLKAMTVIRDISERKQAEQQLRELAQRLTYHVDHSPLAVIEWGPSIRVTRWSSAAERLFGWEASEALDKSPEDLGLSVNDLQDGGEHYITGRRIVRKDGGVIYSEWYNSLLLDDDGNLRSILSLVLDVTARTEAERTLRRLNTDLEQFAYAASHDLQEPLRTVCIFGDLLEKKFGSTMAPEAREHLEFVLLAAQRMMNLLNGLRAYLHATTLSKSAPQLTDAGDPLNEVLNGLQHVIASQKAIIHVGPLPAVAVDPIHLEQLFQNLIGNALKFRSERSPVISISAEASGRMWQFAVRDNGIGIDPRYCLHIFGVFKRLHAKDRYEGTGIGLALCQKIVERYGGSIWVESQTDAGSTFYFTLPGVSEQVNASIRASAASAQE